LFGLQNFYFFHIVIRFVEKFLFHSFFFFCFIYLFLPYCDWFSSSILMFTWRCWTISSVVLPWTTPR
jgi:hypothetical protein